MATWEVIEGDCVATMAGMAEASVDCITTDPPYGLDFMGREWDSFGGRREAGSRGGTGDHGVLPGYGRGGTSEDRFDFRQRSARAFQKWSETWAREAFRVLKPGGHLLAFGGTRTSHRLICAVEDAGFEVRDSIVWLYGSGFPKSLDVAKAIDKAKGEVGTFGDFKTERHATWGEGYGTGKHEGYERPWTDDPEAVDRNARRYVPGSPEAEAWSGWGTALKPAHEPIVVARRPLIGTVASNVLAHGTGAFNIDACRVGTAKDTPTSSSATRSVYEGGWQATDERTGMDPNVGRWPANVVLSHTEDCVLLGTREVASDGHHPASRPSGSETSGPSGHAGQEGLAERYAAGEVVEAWDCAEGCPVRALDEQTGDLHSQDPATRFSANASGGHLFGDRQMGAVYGDEGGASRFFATSKSDTLCALCLLPCVTDAASPSSPSGAHNDAARASAQAESPPESEDNGLRKIEPAKDAASGSATTRAMAADDSALPIAPTEIAEWIVRAARDAVNLCDSCGTATAQSVARILLGHDPDTSVGQASTLALRQRTLSRNLALAAAGAASIGITPTTELLSALSGYALAVTSPSIPISGTDAALARSLPLNYVAKASTAERNAGLGDFEEQPGPSNDYGTKRQHPMKAEGEPNIVRPVRNVHPTVKSIELMRWLIRLVCPPGGTVLDPFAGSGSTGCAAMLEPTVGRFVGIEREAEYVAIARARIAWWSEHPDGMELTRRLAAERERTAVRDAGQLDLF